MPDKPAMRIVEDDLRGAAIKALLDQHLDWTASLSPPESVHALNLDELQTSAVTVWTAWDGDELLGCGALQELDVGHGEIKSMRTAQEHLGKGVASALLQHIIEIARRRGYKRLSLETGSAVEFAPAHALYQKHGFEFSEPFGSYRPDPYSAFMTRIIRKTDY